MAATLAQAEDVQRLGAVESTAQPMREPPGATVLEPLALPRAPRTDTSALLDYAPGAATVRNGSLTGIAQLRGLFNERVRIDVEGMSITPACPNHMDPPLHYSAPTELESLAVLPGITPVSLGGDSIAGTIVVKGLEPAFFPTGQVGVRGEVGAGYSGMNEAASGDARAEAGNDRLVATLSASMAEADNIRFPGGTVQDTGYRTRRGAARLDARTGEGRTTVELGATRTADAGTPALPMDLVKDDADRARIAYAGTLGVYRIESGMYWHDIDHLMDNYSLRPNSGMRMQSPASSRDVGFNLKAERPRWGGTLRIGAEFHGNDQDVHQRNVATGATQDTFRDASRNRVGLFGEWESGASKGWRGLYGVRVDHVMSDTGDIVNAYPPSSADRAAFNAREHSIDDTDWDATAQWRCAATETLEYRIGVARKSRAPSLLERYLWTPLSASAGQADGRTYLGNLELDPEVSHQISLGLAYRADRLQVSPSLFYNRVSDYIQGLPIARLDSAGRPVLQYQNLEAELYGIDGSWQFKASSHVQLGGTLAYVRARNLDTHDNLYRIAPLNGQVYLDLKQGAWTHRAELRAAARQNEVAAFNGERETGGWAVANVRTQWQRDAWVVKAGVENLFDREYQEHLAGVNRVAGGDVAVGAAIPSAGRYVYLEGRIFW